MDGAESRTFPVGIDQEFSRRNSLKTAGWATAALAAAGFGGVTLAGRQARAQGAAPYTTYQGLGDAAILSLAYQLELLEGNFYAAGVDSGLFVDDFSISQLAAIRDHEFAHADAIAGILNTLGAPFNFGRDPGGPADKTLYLTLPKLGLEAVPVFDSADEKLEEGVIHVPATGFPWQEGANTYIAGHRIGFPGTRSDHVFYDLEQLAAGDEIILTDSAGGKYVYVVPGSKSSPPTTSRS